MTIPQLARKRILILRKQDLAISAFQRPSLQVPQDAWDNESVRLIAQNYARFASQRLLSNVVNDLMTCHREGVFPTLRQVADAIDDLRPQWGSRQAGYKESISYVLRDLLNCTGAMWDYSFSTFLEVLTSSPGLAIIELEDLPQEHFAFLVTFVARWIYFRRLYGGEAIL